jgi:hypothetical protein
MKRACWLLVLATLTASGVAAAEDRSWVDRPITLDPLHASFGVGLGVGQYQNVTVDPTTMVPSNAGQKFGTGALFDAAVGLPFLGELGARIGYRFGAPLAQGDSFARLYDHEAPFGQNTSGNAFGGAAFSNPEFRLRGTLFDAHVVQMTLETRLIAPIVDTNPDFSISPGAGIRVHVPHFMRIDTGIFAIYAPDQNTNVVLSVPVQVWFQVEDAFFGPMSGFRYDFSANGAPNRTEIPGGLGGGYTFGKMLDVMGQVYAYNLDSTSWSQSVGAGIAVQLLVP